MYITSLDITIQFFDANGAAAAVTAMSGVVRNSIGELVQTIDLNDVVEETPGFYTIRGYDVSDSNTFPGTGLTIVWSTTDADRTPEVARQNYTLFAQHPAYVRSRYLIWEPSPLSASLYGYQVERQLPGETGYTVVGNTTTSYFFEEEDFALPATFHRAKYRVSPLEFTESSELPQPTTTMVAVKRVESPHLHCRLYGRITDVQGSGYPAMVSFFVHEIDTPQEIGGSHLMRRNEVNVYPNARGEFSIPLIQGALVTVEASDICLNSRFVVPREYSFNFKDLEFYPFDTTYRAQ